MKTPSNLPPGCSSPDGGLDHAMEAALDDLVLAIPSIECAKLLKLLAPVVEHIYQIGYSQGVMEGPEKISSIEDYKNKSQGE